MGSGLWWAADGSVGFVSIFFVFILVLYEFFKYILMYCIYYFNVLYGIIEYLL